MKMPPFVQFTDMEFCFFLKHGGFNLSLFRDRHFYSSVENGDALNHLMFLLRLEKLIWNLDMIHSKQ